MGYVSDAEVLQKARARVWTYNTKRDAIINDSTVLSKVLDVEEVVDKSLPVALVEHALPLELEVSHRIGRLISPKHKLGDYTNALRSTTNRPPNISVLSRRSNDRRSISQHDFSSNDAVKCNAPLARCVAVAAMGEVTADADAGTSAMGKSAMLGASGVNAVREVTKADTSTDGGDVALDLDGLELLEGDHHAAILAAGGEGGVGVAAGFGLDLV